MHEAAEAQLIERAAAAVVGGGQHPFTLGVDVAGKIVLCSNSVAVGEHIALGKDRIDLVLTVGADIAVVGVIGGDAGETVAELKRLDILAGHDLLALFVHEAVKAASAHQHHAVAEQVVGVVIAAAAAAAQHQQQHSCQHRNCSNRCADNEADLALFLGGCGHCRNGLYRAACCRGGSGGSCRLSNGSRCGGSVRLGAAAHAKLGAFFHRGAAVHAEFCHGR